MFILPICKNEIMIINEEGKEIKLGHENTYAQLSKEKRGYKECLNSIFTSCTVLEHFIKSLCKISNPKLSKTDSEKWINNPNVSLIAKLRELKSADVISEELYNNISVLFKIRNKFAHEFMAIPKKEVGHGFELLENVDIGNDFVKNLPDDSVKFQLIFHHCFAELLYISKRIDPNSVLELESTDETTFEILDY